MILNAEILNLGSKNTKPFVGKGKRRIKIGSPVNLIIPDIVKEETALDFNPNDYISFGSDNLFAEGLAAINRRAITQRSILSWKAFYVAGQGFETKDKSLEEWTLNSNRDKEKFTTVFKRIIEDFNEFGNAYVEVVTDRARSFFFMYQWDPTTIRLGRKTRKGFVGIFPNWEKIEGRVTQIKWIPLFKDRGLEQMEDGFLHAFVHIRDYEPQFPNYGLPVWVAALDAAGIGHKTNKWNISRLDNQFSTSGILEIYGDKDDKKLLDGIKKFNENKIGEGNNAKVLVIVRERGGEGTSKYTPLIVTNEGDWINLHKQSDQDIVIANNWFRSLSGLQEPGKLGSDTQMIRNQYQIALSTVIPSIRSIILDNLSPVLEELGGFNTENFKVKDVSPVSIADRIDPNFVLTRKQGYDILGVDPDDDDKTLDQTIKVNTATPDEPRPAD